MKKILSIISLALLSGGFTGSLPAQNLQLEYSTYLGGSGNDTANGLAVDSTGSAFLAGSTTSTDFPTANPYQPSFGGGNQNVFVSQLSSTGSSLVYSTYLGGSDYDYCSGLALGSNNDVFLTGETTSTDFPTANPYQASYGGAGFMAGDAFVSQLSSTGTSLVYSTYLGGVDSDSGNGIAVDSQNRAYLSGSTDSDTDFPLANPYQSSYGGGWYDAFVTSLSSTGTSLIYSTYLGGSNSERGYGITLDSNNRAYLSGWTGSTDFPMVNPYQPSFSGWTSSASNVFVSSLSSTGTSLVYSTYLGGGQAYGYSVTLDSRGGAWLTGCTYNNAFPTANPYQPTWSAGTCPYGGPSSDAFISQLSSTGSSLIYSTYLGGSGSEQGNRIVLDSEYRAFLTGYTGSTDFPTANPYQATFGGGTFDAFVTSISSTGSSLLYSTYLGGNGEEQGSRIVLDSEYRAFLTGYTSSTDFPTANPYQGTWSEGTDYMGNPTTDIFISRLSSPRSRRYIFDSGDYDGDGTSDVGIFRDTSGLWAIRGITRLYFGGYGDQTVGGDYNGDGTSDIGIFRDSTSLWAIRGITRLYFGSSTDQPVPGDYNGDQQGEPGIYRDTSGLWAIRGITRLYFGSSLDQPLPGDYSGDGTADTGIFRDASGLWAIRGITRLYFGSSSDEPVPGDYNPYEKWEVAIYHAISGLWAIRENTRIYFGGSSDQPLPSDYDGDQHDDIGIFRDTSGLWAIRGITRLYFGSSGDIPVTR